MERSGLAGLLWLSALVISPAQGAMVQGGASEYIVLDTAHPDWREIVDSQVYADWAVTQPEWVKKIIRENGNKLVDGAAAARVFSRYKAYVASLAAAKPRSAHAANWIKIATGEGGVVVYLNAEA